MDKISPEVIFEICREYRSAADRAKQIRISSELHLLSKQEVIDILRSRGYNPPVVKTRRKPREKASPITLTYNGETKTIYGWVKVTGLTYHAIHSRFKAGWSDERILTTPLQSNHKGADKPCLTE